MEKEKDNKFGATEGSSGQAVEAVRVLVVSEDVIVKSSTKTESTFMTESKYIFDFDRSVEWMISRFVDAGWRVAVVSSTDMVAMGEASPQTVYRRSEAMRGVLGLGDVFGVSLSGDKKYKYPHNLRSLTRAPNYGALVLVEYRLGHRGMIVDWDHSLFVSNHAADQVCAADARVQFLSGDQFLKYGDTIAARTFDPEVTGSDPVPGAIDHAALHEKPVHAPQKEAAASFEQSDGRAPVRVLCLVDEGVPAEIVGRFQEKGWFILGPPLNFGTGAALKEFVEGMCNPIWEKSLVVGDDNVSLGMALYCGAQFMTTGSLGDAEAFVGYAQESQAIATGKAVSPGEEKGELSPEPGDTPGAQEPAPVAPVKPKNKVRVLCLVDEIDLVVSQVKEYSPKPLTPAQPTASRWRKVSEELPAYDKKVLVYYPEYPDTERIRQGFLSRSSTDSIGAKHYFYIQDVAIEECSVTHWMPLPEPPKE